MTLPVTIALLALWSMAMCRYGRSILFPPASLGTVWTLTLLAVWLSGDIYYPLTSTADEIVLAGVVAFSVGGICAVIAPVRKSRSLATVSPQAAYTGRPMVDRRRVTFPAEHSFLLPVFQTPQRNHCPTPKPVETDSHRVQ